MGFDLFSDSEHSAAERHSRFQANEWSWRPILAVTSYATEVYLPVLAMCPREFSLMSVKGHHQVSDARALEFSLALTHLLRLPGWSSNKHGQTLKGVLLDDDLLLTHYGSWGELEDSDIHYAATLEQILAFAHFCAWSRGFAVS